jgi:putative Holliday junction resolvase
VETVPRGDGDLARLHTIATEENAVELVVGLPVSLSGGEGPAAAKVREFANALAAAVAPMPVRLCDERLSTVTAESVLRERGKKGQKRRAVVDQAAAVVILQNALETERSTGRAPGETVPAPKGE